MGNQATGTILDTVFRIAEISAAAVAQCVQRAVAEQTAEAVGIADLVAGEILTFSILIEIVIWHTVSPFLSLLFLSDTDIMIFRGGNYEDSH